MKLPWEIKVSLRPGTVYYMRDNQLSSAEPHYFVVVNGNPIGDEILLLAVASSQIEKVKRRYKRESDSTLVEISPAEYTDFTKDTIIDCNHVFTKSLLDLCDQWQRKEITPKGDIPSEILKKLQQGVIESRLVSPADKDKIQLR